MISITDDALLRAKRPAQAVRAPACSEMLMLFIRRDFIISRCPAGFQFRGRRGLASILRLSSLFDALRGFTPSKHSRPELLAIS